MFGAGFIISPVSGGLLGDCWIRLPFLAAAILTAANLLMALFVLPESRVSAYTRLRLAALNQPTETAALSMKKLIPIVLVFFILSGIGDVYGIC